MPLIDLNVYGTVASYHVMQDFKPLLLLLAAISLVSAASPAAANKPIHPDAKADLNDPCLARRLALWSLEQIKTEDMGPLMANILFAVGLEEPEVELPMKILKLAAETPEPLRMAIISAAARGGQRYLADESLDGLSEDALKRVARELGLTGALDLLDPEKHKDIYLEFLLDDQVNAFVREGLVENLQDDHSAAVIAALQKAAEDPDCSLAMAAASALAATGDDSALPARPRTDDVDLYGRGLCMLAHHGDDERGERLWRDYVAPGGYMLDFVEDDDMGESAEDDADALEEEGELVPRGDTSLSVFRGRMGYWVACDAKALTCRVAADQYADDHATISFGKAKDGGLHITDLEIYSWSGCGC